MFILHMVSVHLDYVDSRVGPCPPGLAGDCSAQEGCNVCMQQRLPGVCHLAPDLSFMICLQGYSHCNYSDRASNVKRGCIRGLKHCFTQKHSPRILWIDSVPGWIYTCLIQIAQLLLASIHSMNVMWKDATTDHNALVPSGSPSGRLWHSFCCSVGNSDKTGSIWLTSNQRCCVSAHHMIRLTPYTL